MQLTKQSTDVFMTVLKVDIMYYIVCSSALNTALTVYSYSFSIAEIEQIKNSAQFIVIKFQFIP